MYQSSLFCIKMLNCPFSQWLQFRNNANSTKITKKWQLMTVQTVLSPQANDGKVASICKGANFTG